MAPKRKSPKPEETRFTIAVDGEGVTLRDVDLRQLAQLLEATAATFEAVAAETGLEAPQLSLAKAKQGSAAYELLSLDRQAKRVTSSLMATVRRRGKGASPRTRTSLQRLFSTAAKSGGSLRLDPPDMKPNAKPVYLSAPVAEDSTQVEEGTVVFARVVGLKLDIHNHGVITLRYDDGGSGNFESTLDFITAGAHLIGRHVMARVTFLRGEYKDFDGAIEEIQEHPEPGDFMEAISAARRDLEAQGIGIDAAAWFAEEREP